MLHRGLDFVRDFFFDFLSRSAGILRDYQRVLDRELGIFEPPHVLVGAQACNDQYDGQGECCRPVVKTEFGKFHGELLVSELADFHSICEVLDTRHSNTIACRETLQDDDCRP